MPLYHPLIVKPRFYLFFSDSQARPLSHSSRKLITPKGPLNSCTHPTLFSSSSSLPVPSTITSVTLRDRLLSKDSQLLQECFLLTRLKTPFVLGDCWQHFQMLPPYLSALPAVIRPTLPRILMSRAWLFFLTRIIVFDHIM